MEIVGAVLDGNVQNCPARAAELCAHGIGLHPELLNRIRRRADYKARFIGEIFGQAVVINAVEQIVILIRAHAVGAEAAGALVAGARSGRGGAGREHRQAREIAAVQRQVHDFLALHDLAQIGRIGLQRRRRGGDFDSFTELTDFESDIDSQTILDIEGDSLVQRSLESTGFHADRIMTNRQRCHHIIAGRIRGCLGSDVGIDIGDCNRSTWHRGAAVVSHCSHDGSGGRLGGHGLQRQNEADSYH